jgi:hypothetical protein
MTDMQPVAARVREHVEYIVLRSVKTRSSAV